MNRPIEEFCLNTYAHGFKYIALKHIHLFERLLWAAIMAVFVMISCYYSFLIWREATEKQTITVADTPNCPIANYMFPAITICNFNIISKSRVKTASRKLTMIQNITLEELLDKLHLIKYLTDIPCSTSVYNDLIELHYVLESNNIEPATLLKHVSPTCKEMIQRCTWKGKHTACEMLFKTIATPHGFCCSFNYFAFNEEVKNVTSDPYIMIHNAPRRVSATGYFTGLETVINSISTDYFSTAFPSFGHKIIVHFPYNFPDRNSQIYLQYIQGMGLISVNPSLYRTDVNVNALDISKRNCAFVGEKRLEYFVYTYENCMSECRANLITELCGCVPFYYRQLNQSKSVGSFQLLTKTDSYSTKQGSNSN